MLALTNGTMVNRVTKCRLNDCRSMLTIDLATYKCSINQRCNNTPAIAPIQGYKGEMQENPYVRFDESTLFDQPKVAEGPADQGNRHYQDIAEFRREHAGDANLEQLTEPAEEGSVHLRLRAFRFLLRDKE